MNTLMQIEKLKKEYEGLLQELDNLQQEYDVLNKEYKEHNDKLFDINDKIDDLMEEEYRITRKIKDEEKKYVEKQEMKIVINTTISTLITLTTFSLIFGRLDILNALVSAAISTVFVSPLVSFAILNSKSKNKIRNKYQQTERYIKNKELVEQKQKEINELRIKKISLGDPYELYKRVSNLEKQIEAKQKEIEEIKRKVFDLLFKDAKEENTKVEITNEQVISYCDEEEKSAPLVKTRRIKE